MAPNPRRLDERLDALYEQIPAIRCRGLCSESCGPIQMSAREKVRIEKASVKALGCDEHCSMLVGGRCSVYDVRPMVCRLWGVVEAMPCPFGCVPEGGRLSNEEGMRLMKAAVDAGGHPFSGDWDRLRAEVLRDLSRRTA